MEKWKIGLLAAAAVLIVIGLFFLLRGEEHPAVEEVGFEEARVSLEDSWNSFDYIEPFRLEDISFIEHSELEELKSVMSEERNLLRTQKAPGKAIDLADLYVANAEYLIEYKSFDDSLNALLDGIRVESELCYNVPLFSGMVESEKTLLAKNTQLAALMTAYRSKYPGSEGDFSNFIVMDLESLNSQYAYTNYYVEQIKHSCALIA